MRKQISERIGEIYNSFKILGSRREKGKTYVRVECLDCGNEKWMRADSVISGVTKSCGCGFKGKDLGGQKFGRLTAIKPTGGRAETGSMMWLCECECGKKVEKPAALLSSGGVRSCGCLAHDLSSKRFKELRERDRQFFENGTDARNLTSKLSKNNTSGYKGVIWDKRKGKWKAEIMFQRKSYRLGSYANIKDAVAARQKAEEKLFGGFLEWFQETYPERYAKLKKKELPSQNLSGEIVPNRWSDEEFED